MSLEENMKRNATPVSRIKTTIDTILLTTLLNREMNADGKVFEVKVSFVPSNATWQAYVDCFKGTYITVNADEIQKLQEAQKFIKKMADNLRKIMEPKQEAGLKAAKDKSAEEGKKQ